MKKISIWPNLRSEKRGISLIEVLVSVMLVSIGIVSSLMYFSTASASTRLARDIMTATNHGEYILEEMRAKNTLNDIIIEDWPAFITAAGLNTLINENISITYADDTADPLHITVTVSWVTNSRSRSVDFVTEMTK